MFGLVIFIKWSGMKFYRTVQKYIAIPSDEATINCLRLRPTSKYFDIVQTSTIETARDLVNLAWTVW